MYSLLGVLWGWPATHKIFSLIFYIYMNLGYFRNFGSIPERTYVLSPNKRIIILFQPLIFLAIPILIPKGIIIQYTKHALKGKLPSNHIILSWQNDSCINTIKNPLWLHIFSGEEYMTLCWSVNNLHIQKAMTQNYHY